MNQLWKHDLELQPCFHLFSNTTNHSILRQWLESTLLHNIWNFHFHKLLFHSSLIVRRLGSSSHSSSTWRQFKKSLLGFEGVDICSGLGCFKNPKLGLGFHKLTWSHLYNFGTGWLLERERERGGRLTKQGRSCFTVWAFQRCSGIQAAVLTTLLKKMCDCVLSRPETGPRPFFIFLFFLNPKHLQLTMFLEKLNRVWQSRSE